MNNEPTREQKIKYMISFFKGVSILTILTISFVLLAKENVVLAFYFLFLIFIFK